MSEHETSKKSLKRNGSKSKRKATANIRTEYIGATAAGTGTTKTKTISTGNTHGRTTTRTNSTNAESDEFEAAGATVAKHDSTIMAVTQFSVQSSGVDGLRMKISAIRPQSINTASIINKRNISSTSNCDVPLTNTITTTTITTDSITVNSRNNNKKQLNKRHSPALTNLNNNNNNNNKLLNNNISTSSLNTLQTAATSTATSILHEQLSNSSTSSLIVKISKSEQLKQQLNRIAKEEAAIAATSKMPDQLVTTNTSTTYTCPIITITSAASACAKATSSVGTSLEANEQNSTLLSNTTTAVACLSDNTESGCSEATTTTVAGAYAELKPTKKVKVKRKKAHSHESKKSQKKLRLDPELALRTTTNIITTQMKKQVILPAFTSDSDDEPLAYRHNQMKLLKQSGKQRAPRILLTAINTNKSSTSALLPPIVATTTKPAITMHPTLISNMISIGGSDHIGLSSSDNELPQLVSAAIERVARGSESDDDCAQHTNMLEYNDNEFVRNDILKNQSRSSKRLKINGRSKNLPQHNVSHTKRKNRLTIPQYQSTLLQDFMEKTQSLGQNATQPTLTHIATPTIAAIAGTCAPTTINTDEVTIVKKRRGRPKKIQTEDINLLPAAMKTMAPITNAINSTLNTLRTESADSGVVSTTSTTQSSTPSPRRNVPIMPAIANEVHVSQMKSRPCKSILTTPTKTFNEMRTTTATSNAGTPTKLDMAYLDKRMYATERVLYPPPRNKRRQSNAHNLALISSSPTKDDTNIDPVWRKIDVNKKFRHPNLSGYKSDGGGTTNNSSTICSKILAAKSGYVSDYGSFHARAISHTHNSGYKSDASCKSRYSTKSCMSRRSGKRRSRRRSFAVAKTTVDTKDEQDILQLAGLSLGHSSEESNEYVCKPNLATLPSTSVSKKYGEINRYVVTGEYFGGRGFTPFALKCPSEFNPDLSLINTGQKLTSRVHIRKSKSRRSVAPSVCSSFYSSTSRARHRHKHRSSRFPHTSRNSTIDSKLITEIDILTSTFSNMCLTVTGGSNAVLIASASSNREKLLNCNLLTKGREKRAQKKRKVSEHIDFASLSAGAGTFAGAGGGCGSGPGVGALTPSSSGTGTKRRHKKTASNNSSPDDHKLPLKKRHYLLSGPGDKCADAAVAAAAAVAAKLFASNTEAWAAAAAVAKTTAYAKSQQQYCARAAKTSMSAITALSANSSNTGLTPKKRHLLQNNSTSRDSNSLSLRLMFDAANVTTHPMKSGVSPTNKTHFHQTQQQQQHQRQHQPYNRVVLSAAAAASGKKKQRSENATTTNGPPPPGVFEPSVALEIQIPPIAKLGEVTGIIAKSEVESPLLLELNKNYGSGTAAAVTMPKNENVRVVEKLLNKTGANLILKRKRKRFNRTGFPTVRRKKRKVNDQLLLDVTADISEEVERLQHQQQLLQSQLQEQHKQLVQEQGGTEMNVRQPRLSVVALERLQGVVPNKSRSSEEMRCSSPAMSVRSRKVGRKHDKHEKEKETRASGRKTGKRDGKAQAAVSAAAAAHGTNTTTKIKEEINNLSPMPVLQVNDGLATKTIKKEAITTNALITTSVAAIPSPNSAYTFNKLKLPPTIKLPAGLDPNTNFCCQIRLKRGLIPNKVTSCGKSNDDSSIVASPHNSSVENEEEMIVGSDLEEDVLEHDILPEDERIVDVDDELRSNHKLSTNPIDAPIPSKKSTNSKCTKKNYLPAGLFSDYFKTTPPSIIATPTTTTTAAVAASTIAATLKNKKNNTLMGKNTSTKMSFLLPPPPYCERYLRRTEIDFQLPYDIWWAYKHSKLPTRVTVQSWKFRKIRTNIYAESLRPNTAHLDLAACYCKPDMQCGNNCLNRVVYTECTPSSCPTGERCGNQKIQRHEGAPGLERFMTDNKGWGMRTKLAIEKGTYILEYVGEVVTEREFKRRMATIYLNDIHHYCLHLDGELVIDGHRMGSDGRFVNHSCEPNCEMQKWSVNGMSRMALFAKRNITAGEELSYDYNFALFNPAEGQPCRCNAPKCRGVIGGKSQRITPLPVHDNSKSIDTRKLRARKNKASKKTLFMQLKDVAVAMNQQLTEKEKKVVKQHRVFLMRNFEKLRRTVAFAQNLNIENNNNTNNNNKNTICDETTNTSTTTTTTPAALAAATTTTTTVVQNNNSLQQSKDTSKRPSTPSTTVAAQISVLSSVRSIKTRGLTQAGQDPEVERMAKMALILREICSTLETLKYPNDDTILATQIFTNHIDCELNISGKRKKVIKPNEQPHKAAVMDDLRLVQTNIAQGYYQQPSEFDEHICKIFEEAKNNHVVCDGDGDGDDKQIKAIHLLMSTYEQQKQFYYKQLFELIGDESKLRAFAHKKCEVEAKVVDAIIELPIQLATVDNSGAVPSTSTFMSQKLPPGSSLTIAHMHGSRKAVRGQRGGHFSSRAKNQHSEDIIRCICGMYKDEGLMIQCAQCMVWQHTECTRADVNAERYLCERCEPRVVDYEIPLDDYTEEGYRYYLSLMRGNLHVRQGDAVYVLRDIPMRDHAGNVIPCKKHTYETIGKIDYQECDIFRVERLWKSSDGKRFIFGHHFLRPHETFHEPTRRFYPNEVVRVPLYEIVPIELVIERCWVLDRTTFCKGRPMECLDESHCYICELRVDKTARFFSKAKISYPVCTKSFAFRMFPEKLRISKTYAPHDVDPAMLKTKKQKLYENNMLVMPTTTTAAVAASSSATKTPTKPSNCTTGVDLDTTIITKSIESVTTTKKNQTICSSKQKSTNLENVLNIIKSLNKRNNQIWLNSKTVATNNNNNKSNHVQIVQKKGTEKNKSNFTTTLPEKCEDLSEGRGTRGGRRNVQEKVQLKEEKQECKQHRSKDKSKTSEKEKKITKVGKHYVETVKTAKKPSNPVTTTNKNSKDENHIQCKVKTTKITENATATAPSATKSRTHKNGTKLEKVVAKKPISNIKDQHHPSSTITTFQPEPTINNVNEVVSITTTTASATPQQPLLTTTVDPVIIPAATAAATTTTGISNNLSNTSSAEAEKKNMEDVATMCRSPKATESSTTMVIETRPTTTTTTPVCAAAVTTTPTTAFTTTIATPTATIPTEMTTSTSEEMVALNNSIKTE